MSSVTRFTRQIPLSTTYYNAPASSGTNYFEFVADPSNYVGNYPPGYMQAATVTIPAGAILKDMGKTFRTTIDAPSSSNTAEQYFRQVQVLVPTTVTSFIGGPTGPTYGVRGDPTTPSSYAPYYTLYVKTTIGGIGANAGMYPIIGGQM